MFINDVIITVAEWGLTPAANHLWQATAFTLLAFFVTLLLSRARAQTRYLVWLVAALKFALPSSLIALVVERIGHHFLWTQESLPAQVGKVYIVSEVAQPLLEPFGAVSVRDTSQYDVLNGVLLLIWLVGFVALVARWMWRRRKFYRVIAGKLSVHEGRAWEMLLRLKRQMNVRADVELKICEATTAPGVWGVRRSVIVMPKGLTDLLDDAELEALLMHELAHVRRRDNLVGTLQMFVCCLFWFHPLVWLIDRRLLAERERACDETVIEVSGAKNVYLSGILKVLRFCLHSRVAGASGAGGSNLQRRITHIMNEKVKPTSLVWHRLIVVFVACAAVIVSLTNGFAREHSAGFGAQSGVQAQGRDSAAPSDEKRTDERPAPRFKTMKMIESATQPGVFDGEIEFFVPPAASKELSQTALTPQQSQGTRDDYSSSPEVAVRFENKDGSPVVINSATMKIVTPEQFLRLFDKSVAVAEQYVTLPTISVVNTSPRRISELGMKFGKGGKGGVILGRAVTIEPGESYSFQGVAGKLNGALPGDGSDVQVEVAWVRWEDGTQWGGTPHPPSPPAPPPPPAPPMPPPPSQDSSASIGRLRLLWRVEPVYPATARAIGAVGNVTVEFMVNASGEVAEAKATDGHPLLRAAALDAIRQFRFEPPAAAPTKPLTTVFVFHPYKAKASTLRS